MSEKDMEFVVEIENDNSRSRVVGVSFGGVFLPISSVVIESHADSMDMLVMRTPKFVIELEKEDGK